MLVENELKKLPKFHISYFRGRNRFQEDRVQNYLVFQRMYKYFFKIGNTESISSWKSKGLSNEVIKPPYNSLAPAVKFNGKRMYLKFSGSCLKQDRITLNHGKTVNAYIVYDLKSSLNRFDTTLQNCLEQLS